MQDVYHALANLRDLTGIPTLDFDADGNLSLLFNGATTVNVAKVDEAAIELWTALDGLGRADDATNLRRLLEANHLGEGTGPARLALAPGGDGFVVCERVDVRGLDDKLFADRIVGFLKHAEFWRSDESKGFAAGRLDRADSFEPDAFAIRI